MRFNSKLVVFSFKSYLILSPEEEKGGAVKSCPNKLKTGRELLLF